MDLLSISSNASFTRNLLPHPADNLGMPPLLTIPAMLWVAALALAAGHRRLGRDILGDVFAFLEDGPTSLSTRA